MPETCKKCGAELSDTKFTVAADGSKQTRCLVCDAMCYIPAPEAESEPEPKPQPEPEPEPES